MGSAVLVLQTGRINLDSKDLIDIEYHFVRLTKQEIDSISENGKIDVNDLFDFKQGETVIRSYLVDEEIGGVKEDVVSHV